ncbi:hypothetical protein TMEN_4885 [Trichophyton mentagrophytes]|nr:hypothetical protein TMEN_4885 [Trichophyton mentagrophytes]
MHAGPGTVPVKSLRACVKVSALTQFPADTAIYIETSQDAGNEAEVGNAVRKSGIPRENFFLVIKVSMRWPSAGGQSYSKIIESVNKIGGMGGYVNLLLIPSLANNIQKRVELWSTLQDVLRTGRTRHIGVGNYTLATFLQMAEALEPAEGARSTLTALWRSDSSVLLAFLRREDSRQGLGTPGKEIPQDPTPNPDTVFAPEGMGALVE